MAAPRPTPFIGIESKMVPLRIFSSNRFRSSFICFSFCILRNWSPLLQRVVVLQEILAGSLPPPFLVFHIPANRNSVFYKQYFHQPILRIVLVFYSWKRLRHCVLRWKEKRWRIRHLAQFFFPLYVFHTLFYTGGEDTFLCTGSLRISRMCIFGFLSENRQIAERWSRGPRNWK